MPLTVFQQRLGRLLARRRAPDSDLAGGAALHFAPNSTRFSNDLDDCHDTEQRVAEAFGEDCVLLENEGLAVGVELKQPGYIRATVSQGEHSTKIEWAHDSAWRFMPVTLHPEAGFILHPIDLAINKLLALAGRDEARDFLDVQFIDAKVLPLGALAWATAGKDPGFTPSSLLELLKRRGRYRPEDFARLHLAMVVDLRELKRAWLSALERAEEFVNRMPADEAGCLYYSPERLGFVEPPPAADAGATRVERHYGRPGGILPRFYQGDRLAEP